LAIQPYAHLFAALKQLVAAKLHRVGLRNTPRLHSEKAWRAKRKPGSVQSFVKIGRRFLYEIKSHD
jgi:hypothetical protein